MFCFDQSLKSMFPANTRNWVLYNWVLCGLLCGSHMGCPQGPNPYPANNPETQAQFSPHIHANSDVGPNCACSLGPNWGPLHTQQTAQKPKPSLVHVSPRNPTWGPTGLANWGPSGAHSIPSNQPRNPSSV